MVGILRTLFECVERSRQAATGRASGLHKRFRREDAGNVAMIFALSAMVAVSMVGGAIDVGRTYVIRSKIQSAADAASLAASSAYVLDPNHDTAAALEKGVRFFNSSTLDVPGLFVSAEFDTTSLTAKLTAGASVKTPFLSMAGINTYTVTTYAEASASESVSGANGENDVEISLMLDTTGSMGSSAGNGKTKIQALKDAAKLLVDILVPDVGRPHARVALVPFAPTVNVGDDLIEAVTGLPATTTTCTKTSNVCVNTTCAKYKSNGSCKTWNQACSQQCTQTQTNYLRRCVTERVGTAMFTDDAPGAGTFVSPYVPSNDTDAYTTSLSSARTCNPQQTIVPLTSDKVSLKATIDDFSANGSTAGWLGTAWAWYMLSPEWNGLFTGTSAPRPYGTEKLKKIAVLMTDGEYNLAGGASANVAVVSENAVSTCTAMKAKGIEVYTVGFKLDNAVARETLRLCATDESHYFDANSGDELEAAFREVAFRSVPIHLAR